MKITAKCKKCGSWAKPIYSIKFQKNELEKYIEFIKKNDNGIKYVPLAIGSTEKNKHYVVPDGQTHPCTLCEHGKNTPGALSCPYEQNCLALAYFFIQQSNTLEDKNSALCIDEFGISVTKIRKTGSKVE